MGDGTGMGNGKWEMGGALNVGKGRVFSRAHENERARASQNALYASLAGAETQPGLLFCVNANTRRHQSAPHHQAL